MVRLFDDWWFLKLTEEILILVPISVPDRSTIISSGMLSAGHFNSTFLLTIFKTPPRLSPGDSGWLIITDTIDNAQKIKNNDKIEVLSIASLMSEAIKRIANPNSVSDLFN